MPEIPNYIIKMQLFGEKYKCLGQIIIKFSQFILLRTTEVFHLESPYLEFSVNSLLNLEFFSTMTVKV